MSDLARQAFVCKNYDLAAEIYERQIKEHGPTTTLHLGLADSLALSGQLRKAFESYANAYRLGKVKTAQLNLLVSALVEAMVVQDPDSRPLERVDMFACDICKAIWSEPTTLNCGHTFCRRCLDKFNARHCKQCGERHRGRYQSLKPNCLLSTTADKWFPEELTAARLKTEGNRFFSKQDFIKALEIYDEALKLVSSDHLLLSNRSYTYASLGRYHEALADAERVIQLRPDWPKGYFRKGAALSALGRHEESAYAYLQCLALDPSVTSARTGLAKTLNSLFSPVAPEQLKASELHHHQPSLLGSLGATNMPPLAACGLTPDILTQVKESLRDTIHKSNTWDYSQKQQQCQSQIHVTDEYANPSLQVSLGRCASAPQSRPSSPSPNSGLRKSPSESKLTEPDACQTSRKRCSLQTEKEAEQTAKLARKHFIVRDVAKELLIKEDFECSLCYRLLHHPVTTPCGHVFCLDCLNRSLDHSSQCPLCKSCLAEFLAERKHETTEAVEQIIETYFTNEFKERLKVHDEEMTELAQMGVDKQHEIPIFVCTLGFPGVPCPLHIFEPRYRLMVRQSMESGTRQFGMCIGLAEDQYADYGTMLEIRDVQYFPDGRSLVDTVGGRRFRVLDRSHREGYHTARVEYLEDTAISENEKPELQVLHDEVHAEAKGWFLALTAVQQQKLSQHLGPFPELEPSPLDGPSGPAWVWWLLAALPLDPRGQLAVLAMNALKDRLSALKKVLSYAKRRGTPL